ncbi:hypothetical protein J1N35_000856 [Gossypium stocksii]|uniref:Uncharacterized protein n=1 Tax=Gossypium stocksii TaxID=47602 RepID=A0A9D3WJI2_9ROSI|nr:hypothetical protein J1N35_000856 [Gossypium stocksii]
MFFKQVATASSRGMFEFGTPSYSLDLYEWREFSLQPQRPAVPFVVHEFYANLKFSKEDKVYVRGRKVEISPSVISKYYRVPFLANNEIELLETRNFKGVNVDYIIFYLKEGRAE